MHLRKGFEGYNENSTTLVNAYLKLVAEKPQFRPFRPYLTPIPNLRVSATEVTQGIQYFSQGSGGGTPNSVPLVEGKTTVLRVGIDITNRRPDLPLPPSVTGEIRYRGVTLNDP
jgi:hypothetical protein